MSKWFKKNLGTKKLKKRLKNTGRKVLWLFAGLAVGIGISSTFAEGGAESRRPASYEFKILAVSEEDANDKAAEMLRTGELRGAFDTESLVSASMPRCEDIGEESGMKFRCETRLLYSL